MIKQDMFKPYIKLTRLADAGIITVVGGHCSDLKYEVCGGQPWSGAHQDAFKLALTTGLPLWYGDKCLYCDANTAEVTTGGKSEQT